MKTSFKLAVAALAASSALASSAAHAVLANATATVVTPIVVVENTPSMNFGSFAAAATPGTVSTAGAVTGGIVHFGGANPGSFNVTGAPTLPYTITADPTSVLTSGANSMTATLTAPAGGTLSGAGTDTFNIIGSLAVAANQPNGTYAGTYNVTVSY